MAGPSRHELEWIDSAARASEALAPDVSGERMIINMGPQHPSTHGVLRLVLALDGEEITDLMAGGASMANLEAEIEGYMASHDGHAPQVA